MMQIVLHHFVVLLMQQWKNDGYYYAFHAEAIKHTQFEMIKIIFSYPAW